MMTGLYKNTSHSRRLRGTIHMSHKIPKFVVIHQTRKNRRDVYSFTNIFNKILLMDLVLTNKNGKGNLTV